MAMNYEMAQAEVNKWLDAKKVKQRKRESYPDAIEHITNAIAEGSLFLSEDFKLTQKLSFPVCDNSGAEVFSELEYKPRLTVFDTQAATKNVKAGDADGRIMAYASALTGKSNGLLGKLDTEDYTLVQSITVFFL